MPEDTTVAHRTTAELDAALDDVRASPSANGTLDLVVCRPGPAERVVLDGARLTFADGVVGDSWLARGSRHLPDGSAHPGRQVTVMNSRFARLVAVDPARVPLAGDQLYVDLDLSESNAPVGTRLAIGTAVIEVTDQPHTGCAKFTQRFGLDAFRFVNSPAGMALRVRGLNARVVVEGTVQTGDPVTKLA